VKSGALTMLTYKASSSLKSSGLSVKIDRVALSELVTSSINEVSASSEASYFACPSEWYWGGYQLI
jgi:hypothetical protein